MLLKELVVIHMYGEPRYDKTIGQNFNPQKTNITMFAASTCMRQVFITTMSDIGCNPFPSCYINTEAHPSKDGEYEQYLGKNAYNFLLRWLSGMENSSSKNNKPNNDDRVKKEVLIKYNSFRASHPDFAKRIDVLMQWLNDDVSHIRRHLDDPKLRNSRSLESLLPDLTRACSLCTTARIIGNKPAYDSLIQPDIDVDSSCSAILMSHKKYQMSDSIPDSIIPSSTTTCQLEAKSRLNKVFGACVKVRNFTIQNIANSYKTILHSHISYQRSPIIPDIIVPSSEDHYQKIAKERLTQALNACFELRRIG